MSRARQADPFGASAETRLTLSEQLTRAPKPANKQQAKLQRLIKDIEKQRQLLREWRDFGPEYQKTVITEFEPAQEARWNVERDIVFALDQALKTRGVLRGKVQQAQAIDKLVDMARDLLSFKDDATLEALHDEYSEQSYASCLEAEERMEKELMAMLFGASPEDDDPDRQAPDGSPFAAADEPAPAGADSEPREPARSGGRTRRPGKRQLEQAALARDASQTVRQVFRSLASKLHPDRESDPAERERKTVLMQRVNQAYAAQDLLELLSLQYEIEQIDPDHLDNLEARRLDEYIYLFGEQLKELKQEIRDLTAPFRAILRDYRPTFRPQTVSKALAADIAQLKRECRFLEQSLAACRHPESLKHWLKANPPEPVW